MTVQVAEGTPELAAGAASRGTLYIDGGWSPGEGEQFECVNPATEQVIARVPGAALPQVADAVAAARRAFDSGPWRRLSGFARAQVIHRFADLIAQHADELGRLGTIECGTPVKYSRAMHGERPAEFHHWWADMAVKGPLGGAEQGLGFHYSPMTSASVLRRGPIGVVAIMTAYNAAMAINSYKVGGALAAGCTVVLLPSPKALLQHLAYVRLAELAGFPPGVVNAVVGGPDVGAELTTSRGVDMISFTGSIGVGKRVMAQAADGLKKVVLELGGKSPSIILPGQDLATVVPATVMRFARNAGQACGATTRLLVHQDEYQAFAGLAREFLTTVQVGDPTDPATEVGPLIRAEHRDNVQSFVARALATGGRIEAGGGPHPAVSGFFFNPVLLGDVANADEVCQTELFGPVGALLPYDDLDDAVAQANDSRFGLNANIWGPADEAVALADRIHAGTVGINGGGGERPDAPWPGYGESGVGTDRGVDGYQEFFTVKHISFPLPT